jgi:hypothetical protein
VRIVFLLLGVSLLAGCGSGGSATAPAPSPSGLGAYQVDATVLQQGDEPAQICFAVAESYPPQCGGVPIANWDWDAVDSKDSASGTTWGMYHLVGTYDGETFAVTDVAPYFQMGKPDEIDLEPACDEPSGGDDPARGTDEFVSAPDTYARQQPDYVASWITYVEDTPGLVVFNAVFTGDAARHEAELRRVWDGPLCVVEEDTRTAAELEQVRQEVEQRVDELGLGLVSSSADRVVDVQVVLDEGGAAQAEFDAKYGLGTVRVTSMLRPVGE